MLYKKENMIRSQEHDHALGLEAADWQIPAGLELVEPTGATVERCLTKSEFFSKQQAGDYVGLSAKTIERLITRGEIEAFKLGGKIRIRCEAIEACIAENVVAPSIHDV